MDKAGLGVVVLGLFMLPIIALVDYEIFKNIPCDHCGKKVFTTRWHYIVPTFVEFSFFIMGILVGGVALN